MTHSIISTSTVDSDCHQLFVIDKDNLPRSVRGAPAELRRAIRRKQNSESARRCRARRRLERTLATPGVSAINTAAVALNVVAAPTPVATRIAQLEAVVKSLSEQLVAAQAQYTALLASQQQSTTTSNSTPQQPIVAPPTSINIPTTKEEPVYLQTQPNSPVNVQQLFDQRTAWRSQEEFLTTIDQLAEL